MDKQFTMMAVAAALVWSAGCGQQDPMSAVPAGPEAPAAKLVVSRTKAGQGLGASGSRASQGARVFSAVISGDQEVPGVTTEGSGIGTFTLNAAKTQLTFKITIYDLAAISAAHFHSAAEGSTGGVVRGFTATEKTSLGANTWRYAGVWTSTDSQPLTPALVEALEAGTLYVNFHTSDHASGELRGQVEAM